MRELFITGVGNISPQKSFDNNHFLDEPVSVESNQLRCIDPNYKEYISGDQVRRMSRIIKMGIAASRICLADARSRRPAGQPVIPDAIITGTGLGCIEDTEKFLSTLIKNKEEFLTPTSFIQSTHNTVSAQIALMLKCHGYNFTYVHRGFSFESAILDSFIQLNTGQAGTVLLGSADELTLNTHAILQRLGHLKMKPVNNLKLFEDHTRGTIAGEGAAFFMLSAEPGDKSYARISGVDAFYQPGAFSDIESRTGDFLEKNRLSAGEIDLVILGRNGDPSFDIIYHQFETKIFPDSGKAYFKHLCGEYFTASSFALWLAAMILQTGTVPPVITRDLPYTGKLENILIYNHFRNIDHSLILVKKA